MDSPRYSVASVVLNEADVVEESVRSLHSAFQGRNFEHVIVDGGSTDGTLEKLESLQDEFYNIVLVRTGVQEPDEPVIQNNRTLGDDRNLSIKKCSGKYIINEYDLDDRTSPEKIELLLDKYHEIEEYDPEAYLLAWKIGVSRRNILEQYSYPGISWAEDKRLRLELASDDRLYELVEPQITEDIKPDDRFTGLKKDFKVRVGEYRSGLTAKSTFKWDLKRRLSMKRLAYRFVTNPAAIFKAEFDGRETPVFNSRINYEDRKKEVMV